MKLSKILLTGSGNIELKIDSAQPSDPFLLKGADGLGPTEVPRIVENGVARSGEPLSRNLVIRIGLNPDYGANQTAEDLRAMVYSLLTSTYDGRTMITFFEGEVQHSYVYAYVSRVEIVPFDQEPVVQVTLDAEGAYLTSFDEVIVDFDALTLTDFEVTNPADARTGFEMELEFTADHTDGWILYSVPLAPERLMFFDWHFLTSDILRFGTQKNERYVTLERDSVETNLIEALTANTTWLDLAPGVNAFEASHGDYNNLTASMRFTPRYLGV